MTTFTTEDRLADQADTPQHWPLDHSLLCKCDMCAIKLEEMIEKSREMRLKAKSVDNHANRG